MAVRRLPIRAGVPALRFRTDLDDTTYEFRFTFNGRLSQWTMDIFDEAGNELVRGVPINVKQLLLKNYKHNTNLPQGDLIALNLVNEDENPTFTNFGDDVLMLYSEPS